jgi:hypothetical protein
MFFITSIYQIGSYYDKTVSRKMGSISLKGKISFQKTDQSLGIWLF